jgi:hypothetical protein
MLACVRAWSTEGDYAELDEQSPCRFARFLSRCARLSWACLLLYVVAILSWAEAPCAAPLNRDSQISEIGMTRIAEDIPVIQRSIKVYFQCALNNRLLLLVIDLYGWSNKSLLAWPKNPIAYASFGGRKGGWLRNRDAQSGSDTQIGSGALPKVFEGSLNIYAVIEQGDCAIIKEYIGAQLALFGIDRSEPLFSCITSGNASSYQGKKQQDCDSPFERVLLFMFLACVMLAAVWLGMFVAPRRGFIWLVAGCFIGTFGWFGVVFQDEISFENCSRAKR